eukprot:SAG31_NODE_640_length_13322_cov_4.396703_7_plen_144_part_00
MLPGIIGLCYCIGDYSVLSLLAFIRQSLWNHRNLDMHTPLMVAAKQIGSRTNDDDSGDDVDAKRNESCRDGSVEGEAKRGNEAALDMFDFLLEKMKREQWTFGPIKHCVRLKTIQRGLDVWFHVHCMCVGVFTGWIGFQGSSW